MLTDHYDLKTFTNIFHPVGFVNIIFNISICQEVQDRDFLSVPPNLLLTCVLLRGVIVQKEDFLTLYVKSSVMYIF